MENGLTPVSSVIAGELIAQRLITVQPARLRPVVLDSTRLRRADFAWFSSNCEIWPARRSLSEAKPRRRSLEVRGLEPLTYSLQSYRSTS
jgi:hypothetical protein